MKILSSMLAVLFIYGLCPEAALGSKGSPQVFAELTPDVEGHQLHVVVKFVAPSNGDITLYTQHKWAGMSYHEYISNYSVKTDGIEIEVHDTKESKFKTICCKVGENVKISYTIGRDPKNTHDIHGILFKDTFSLAGLCPF